METNDKLKIALVQETEKELLKMIEQVETIQAGDLQTLEQSVLRTCLALGRTMMEQILNHPGEEAERPSRREGACGHRQHLVGRRSNQLHTLMGKVTVWRPYYHCVVKAEEPSATCHHGQAPWDSAWGQIAGRTSPGVQKLLGKLVSRLTLSEAVDTFTSILPLPMSERQALNLIQPIGEALREQEAEQVQGLFEQAAHKERQASESGSVPGPSIRRLSSETDGVMARIRRGSVTMEEAEARRTGDVYREIKVGAVFEGLPGRERSELVPGVFLDEPGPLTYVAQWLTGEEFGRFLYALAQRCGLDRAREVVILGDGARWIRHVVEDHFPHAVHIVDISHAREHLWNVATAVHGSGTPQGAAWATQADELLPWQGGGTGPDDREASSHPSCTGGLSFHSSN